MVRLCVRDVFRLSLVVAMLVLSLGLTPQGVADDSLRVSDPTGWIAGKHYEDVGKLGRAYQKGTAIQVVEFFWLGCPHCFALESHVLQWVKAKPQNVTFRQVSVGWNVPERVAHAKLFFTLEKLGRLDLQRPVFEEIHVNKNRLHVPNDDEQTKHLLREFAQAHGVEPNVFLKVYSSGEAEAYVTQANQLAVSMHVQGVPSVSVNGRYTTDVARAGGPQKLFELVDYLVKKERHELSEANSGKKSSK
jgi:thiol:disulfide interchange protein DsbA